MKLPFFFRFAWNNPAGYWQAGPFIFFTTQLGDVKDWTIGLCFVGYFGRRPSGWTAGLSPRMQWAAVWVNRFVAWAVRIGDKIFRATA